jgi:hypothetical protein
MHNSEHLIMEGQALSTMGNIFPTTGKNFPIMGNTFPNGYHFACRSECMVNFLSVMTVRSRFISMAEALSLPRGFLITPMVTHLLDDEGNSMLGIPQEALDESLDNAANDIPDAVAGIAQFWCNT